MSRRRLTFTSSALQEHAFDMSGYQRFLQKLIVELATERRTIVKLVGFPDGTFGMSAYAASTGAGEPHHIELKGGACPHCLILYTMGALAGQTSLDFDEAFVARTSQQYVRILREHKLPELFAMHVSTLQGSLGRKLARQTQSSWITDCRPADSQPERMPFTGGCAKHAFSGR